MNCCIALENDLTKLRYFLHKKIKNIIAFAISLLGENTEKQRANVIAEEILNIYGNSILRLAYSYVKNMSDAEEILQDTIIKYIEKSPDFENENHKKAWLMKVCANLSKNRIEYNKIRMSDELSDELTEENRTDLSFVWDAVKTLEPNYREAIHLFYYEGFSTSEIAKILGKNESTVRSNLSRGRQKLKSVLKEAYDFE